MIANIKSAAIELMEVDVRFIAKVNDCDVAKDFMIHSGLKGDY